MAEEHHALGLVAEKRFLEFRAGRAAARCALAALGVPSGPILPGPDRVPRFPEGIVGSISHCSAHVFAAVARKGDIGGLGIDVEDDLALDPCLIDLVTTEAERRVCTMELARWATLAFSAKEAVFKCWYTCGGGRLADFHEFELRLDPDGAVHVQMQPDPQMAIDVRWARAHGAYWVLARLRLDAAVE